MPKRLMTLAGILIFIAALGSAIWSFFPREENGPDIDFVVGVTAFSIGVITFFGIVALDVSEKSTRVFSGERLRTAIACSLVMSYLFMTTFTVFVKNAKEIGEVTKTFVASFSSVIGITIAFFFGASAATQVFSKTKDDQKNGDGEKKE